MHDKKQTVLLLYIEVKHSSLAEDKEEFINLAEAINVGVQNTLHIKCYKPNAKYFIGKGQAQQISEYLQKIDAKLVLVNKNMSPAQERNLEQICKARFLGYTGLILDIFSRRAHSYIGKLQVELAQLDYLSTRLIRGWSHLERQKGGIGLRGPGEKQLETDRRLIKKRITLIKKRLEKVKNQHDISRRLREKNRIPMVTLVGYTNAGKSTLFNRLALAETYTADKLFATLDVLMRKMYLREVGNIIISDTVGFIRNLPHTLIEAFHATLTEICSADLLLHVIDDSYQDYTERQHQVESILQVIGANQIPHLLVFNKSDISGRKPMISYDDYGMPKTITLSATQGTGIDLLKQSLVQCLTTQ